MSSRLWYVLQRILIYPVRVMINRSQNREMIESDIHRWIFINDMRLSGAALPEKLTWLFFVDHMQEFRNFLYYRIGIPDKLLDRWLLALSRRLFKPLLALDILTPSIGSGLVIKHGVGTIIEAEKVGKNCLIFQDVIIGCKNEDNDRPVLGDYVHVSAGAKILGKITIGDHAVIAANSVVTKDMPPNSLALGVPARIISNAGNKAQYIAIGEVAE